MNQPNCADCQFSSCPKGCDTYFKELAATKQKLAECEKVKQIYRDALIKKSEKLEDMTALRDWAMEQYLESQKAWRKEVAKRKELAEQEPVPSHWDCGCGWHNSLEFPVCAACSRTPNDGSGVWRYKPVPPPDLQKRVDELEAFEDECANLNAELKDYQETLAENAALKKKLAEQQAIIKQVKDYGFHHCNDVWNICVATEKDGTEELASYLSAARAEGVEEGKKMAVPEGWQVVPKEPTPNMVDATWTEDRLLIESHDTRNKRIYAAMLAASPTNKEG